MQDGPRSSTLAVHLHAYIGVRAIQRHSTERCAAVRTWADTSEAGRVAAAGGQPLAGGRLGTHAAGWTGVGVRFPVACIQRGRRRCLLGVQTRARARRRGRWRVARFRIVASVAVSLASCTIAAALCRAAVRARQPEQQQQRRSRHASGQASPPVMSNKQANAGGGPPMPCACQQARRVALPCTKLCLAPGGLPAPACLAYCKEQRRASCLLPGHCAPVCTLCVCIEDINSQQGIRRQRPPHTHTHPLTPPPRRWGGWQRP